MHRCKRLRKNAMFILWKNCPFSRFLWLPASASLLMVLFIASATTIPDAVEFYIPERVLSNFSLLIELYSGISPLDVAINDFSNYTAEIVSLIVICTATALLQYILSSCVATAFT